MRLGRYLAGAFAAFCLMVPAASAAGSAPVRGDVPVPRSWQGSVPKAHASISADGAYSVVQRRYWDACGNGWTWVCVDRWGRSYVHYTWAELYLSGWDVRVAWVEQRLDGFYRQCYARNELYPNGTYKRTTEYERCF